MAEKKPSEVRLGDPLSQVTRKERRLLLGVGMIGITIVKTGLVPSKIAALGIEFSQTDQKSLLWILALINLYFLAAFTIYAVSDFISWRIAYLLSIKTPRSHFSNASENGEVDLKDKYLEQADFYPERYKVPGSNRAMLILSKPASIIRALFEFLLPIAVGVYAIFILLK